MVSKSHFLFVVWCWLFFLCLDSSPAIGELNVVQVEISASDQSVLLHSDSNTQLTLGLMAIGKIYNPTINGIRLVSAMLTGALFEVGPGGMTKYTYHDDFSPVFRGRSQYIPAGTDVEDLLHLPEGKAVPRVLMDASVDSVSALVMDRGENGIYWVGDLIYEFDFGLPVTGLSLSSTNGELLTKIVDQGGGASVSLSSDGVNWIQVWSSPGGGSHSVETQLPDSLKGATRIFVKFSGNEAKLISFFLQAQLDGTSLMPLISVGQGEVHFQYSDSSDSSHRAHLFFKGDGISLLSGDTQTISYPSEAPSLAIDQESISILFPKHIMIRFVRSSSGGISALEELVVADRLIMKDSGLRSGVPALTVVGDGSVGGVTDWASYLEERAANGMEWPRRGGRGTRTLPLSDATLADARVDGQTVVLTLSFPSEGDNATLQWRFSAVDTSAVGHTFSGVSWSVEVHNVPGATWFNILEPVRAMYGNWAFQQTWGRWYEAQIDFIAPFTIPEKWYFADSQPYYFTGGRQGIFLSGFDRVTAAKVKVVDEDGYHYVDVSLPLAAGSKRSSAARGWLWSSDTVGDKWGALDLWTDLYDSLASVYRKQVGVDEVDPKPIMIWSNWNQRPDPAQGQPPLEQSLFFKTAQEQLPRAGHYGFAVLMLDAPWESDWDHSPNEYLVGSGSWGSGNAPWRITPSPLQGGQPGLDYLAQQAAQQGIELVLWNTPGHLSNSSPLLLEHPEWVRWSISGVPEVAGYDDVTGTVLDGGWFDYALGQVKSIHTSAPFSGFLVDSWLTFGTYVDGGAAQPEPVLSTSMAMQKAWRDAGITEIYIEGAGPIGISSGGFGAESLGTAEDAAAREAYSRIKGREYGLYRYSADMVVEPESYYRTLASKGVVPVYGAQIGSLWSDETMSFIRRYNLDYKRVYHFMQHRHLIGDGDQWLGVSWTKDGFAGEVLFAFSQFDHTVAQCALVEDVSSGTTFRPQGAFTTEPYHTYLIFDGTPDEAGECTACAIQGVRFEGAYTSIPAMGDLWPNTWADDGNLYLAFGDATGMTDCLPTLLLDQFDIYDEAYVEQSPGCYLVKDMNNEYCQVFSCDSCLPLCQYTNAGLIRLSGTVPNFDPCTGPDQCVVGRHIPYGDLSALTTSDKPSSLIFINGRLYAHMHYPAGEPTHGYLAYSDDYGVQWHKVDGSPWGADSNFKVMMFINMGQAYELNRDGYLYALATPGEVGSVPTDQQIYLARVPITQGYRVDPTDDPILNYANYEYYAGLDDSGEPIWCSDQKSAVPLAGLHTRAQCSAMYHEYTNTYLLFCGLVGTAPGEEAGQSGVTDPIPVAALYEAANPWGPWRRAGLVPGGFIGSLIPKDSGPGWVYFTAAGGGGVTYNLNIGKLILDLK